MKRLAAELGFDTIGLLDEALTHASASGPARASNQRLEFLGDRVLGLVIAQALCQHYPNESEGELSRRLNALVTKEACAERAQMLGLGDVLLMTRAESLSGGRRKAAILGDAMEAVLGAVYLELGFGPAQALVLRLWSAALTAPQPAPRDTKSALQEWAQGRGLPLPLYEVLGRDGPDHQPVFHVRVSLTTGQAAAATGASRRGAEAAAAAALLAQLTETT